MTTKVVDFLNESGGSNFTETAPRPPVYGEENELQSNGGNSTRSGSSHKSQVSNKSHSSSKSGTSAKGDHSHSPAMTPRKSNLEGIKSADVVSAGLSSQSNLCEMEESEMSAPLGFHPEGSAANSPPYSESGTPPHLKWAENLKYLLDDSEGVELFKDFMENELEGGSEELQFWFACQGLKRKIDSDSIENLDSTITNIQKAIYKRYVRSDKVKCISKEVKREIADKVGSKSIDHNVFDAAQEEVETSMRNVTYPAFLRSDYYVQYVQNYGDSPKSSQSSGSNSARPVSQSGLLPVVHEDKELETRDLSFRESMPCPVINKVPSTRRSDQASSSRHSETFSGSSLYHRSSSSYPAHVSYAPVSAQDSELQSLSSDALTDDTISVTDSSVDGYPLHIRKRHPRKAMKSLAQQNREHRTGLTGQIIPRTEHAPKDRNIAETDPKRFADLLMEKLSKVLEEREADAKVEEKLRSISEVEKSSLKSDEEKLVTSFAKHNTSASFIPHLRAMEDSETAESILDQHCSRIWASSSHHTPSYSPPGGKSPDRLHKDSRTRNKAALLSGAGPSGHMVGPGVPPHGGVVGSGGAAFVGGGGRGPGGYHHSSSSSSKKRDLISGTLSSCDSGITDGGAGGLLCGTETHRHIHHHHHHHHSSRESTAKASRVEMEAVQCGGLTTWRGAADTPQTFVDFPPPSSSGDYSSASARGRISARSKGLAAGGSGGGSGGLRKSSETSSNMDSGVSGMYNRGDPLRVPPNWNNPTGEKVMKWMMDSETVQEVTGVTVMEADRTSSSHKRSHRLNQSTGSAQQSRPSSRSKTSTRSTSVERSGGLLSAWSATPAPILPNQPFVQDSSMPLPTPPNPTTQLEEAKRRLENQSQTTIPVKSKSFTGMLSKDKVRPPGSPGMPPPPHTRTLPSTRNVPTELDTSANSQTLDSRVVRRVHTASAPSSLQPSPSDTIIGIYMGQEPIPYRHQLPGRAITLAQIKTLVTKRGPFKYFFKRDSDEFGDGAVFEEITDESSMVPMWQGKIVVKVEKQDS